MNGFCCIHTALWTFPWWIFLYHHIFSSYKDFIFHCKDFLPGFSILQLYNTVTITYLLTIAVFVFSFLFMIHYVGIQCLSGEISSFLSLLHAVPSCPSARKDISLRVSTKMCINIPHISPLSLAVSGEGRPQEVNEWSRCLAQAKCQPSPWYPKTNGLPVALNATFFLAKAVGLNWHI